jgi:hypothetical protein
MPEVRSSPSGRLVSINATGIPDGSYVGQPVYWDGETYEPLPLDLPLIFSSIETPDGFRIRAPRFVSVVATDLSIEIECTNGSIAATAGQDFTLNVASGTSLMTATVSGMVMRSPVVQLTTTSALDFLTIAPSSIFMSTPGEMLFDSATLGFFAQTPTPRPTVTGATTQDQVDSVIAALVALGLVIDGR